MSLHVRLTAFLTVAVVAASAAIFLLGSSGGASTACLAKNQAVAKLKTAAGDPAGKATFGVHSTCRTKVTVALTGVAEGFHGFHVHTTGVCDPAAQDPAGNASPFYSAGGHFNPGTTDHGSHAGDLLPQLVTDAGDARSWFLTSRFQVRDLFDDDGSAVILHAGADNLANIPATSSSGGERYHSHQYDTMGADEDSKKTGDAGSRFACGVVEKIKRG